MVVVKNYRECCIWEKPLLTYKEAPYRAMSYDTERPLF